MSYFFCFMMFHEMKGDDFIHVYRAAAKFTYIL